MLGMACRKCRSLAGIEKLRPLRPACRRFWWIGSGRSLSHGLPLQLGQSGFHLLDLKQDGTVAEAYGWDCPSAGQCANEARADAEGLANFCGGLKVRRLVHGSTIEVPVRPSWGSASPPGLELEVTGDS